MTARRWGGRTRLEAGQSPCRMRLAGRILQGVPMSGASSTRQKGPIAGPPSAQTVRPKLRARKQVTADQIRPKNRARFGRFDSIVVAHGGHAGDGHPG